MTKPRITLKAVEYGVTQFFQQHGQGTMQEICDYLKKEHGLATPFLSLAVEKVIADSQRLSGPMSRRIGGPLRVKRPR